MKLSKHFLMLLLSVLLVGGALIISSCGGDDSDDGGSDETTVEAPADSGEDTGGGDAGGGELLDDPNLPPAPENIGDADVAGAQQVVLDSFGTPEFVPAGEAFSTAGLKPAWLVQADPSVAVTVPVGPAFEEAGDRAGVETVICQGRSTAEGNTICIDRAIQEGAGSIVIFSIDPEVLAVPLKKAQDAGIKVISGNNALRIGNETEPNTDASVSHDYYDAGYKNGAYAVAALGADVNALCITIPEFKVTESVCEGFADAVEEFAPGSPVTSEGVTVAQLVEQTTALTNSTVLGNSDLNFIMTSIDDLAPAVVAQLKRMGKKPGDILVGGQNGTADALQRIAEGDFQVVTAGQNTGWWGWAFFDGAIRAQADAIGKEAVVTAPNKLFTAESFKSDGPFTYENADALYEFGNGEVYKDGYSALWEK